MYDHYNVQDMTVGRPQPAALQRRLEERPEGHERRAEHLGMIGLETGATEGRLQV